MAAPDNAKHVTILGASARAAAFSARAAGFRPSAIDLFADRDLSELCAAAGGRATRIERYPQNFWASLAAAPAAPWIYTGGLENHPRLIERLARLRPLWGNGGTALRGVRDPARVAAVARRVGLKMPETISAGQPLSSPLQAGDNWLVKPKASSGGLSIRLAKAADLVRVRRGSYLQRLAAGTAGSALFVAIRGSAALLGCSRQIIGKEIGDTTRPFLYVGSIAPLDLAERHLSALCRLGDRLAADFGLAGLFGVDFIVGEHDLSILEVNPRYTASVEVLERATGASCFSLHAATCSGRECSLAAAPVFRQFSGKRIVYARQEAIVPPAFEELVERWNRPGQPPAIADLPRVGDVLSAGQPIVSVFAEADTLAAVERTLEERAELVGICMANTQF